MRVLASNRLAVGNKVYVYANKRAVLVDGRLRHIPDVVSVAEDNGDYVIRFEDQWIACRPAGKSDRAALAAAQVSRHLDPWHFGPELDVALLGAGSLSYRISHSSGVHYDRKTDALVFDRCPELGLSLRLWKAQFADELVCDLARGEVSLQLEAAKRAILEDDLNGRNVLNLDPEVVVHETAEAYARYTYNYPGDPSDPGAWDQTRDVESANSTDTSVLGVGAVHIPICQCFIERGFLQFDTSGLDTPISAVIRLYRSTGVTTNVRLIGDAANLGPAGTASNYGAILVNAEFFGTLGGAWTLGEGNKAIRSGDLVALDAWQASAAYRFGLMEFTHDVSDYDEANNPITQTYDVTGEEAARLELTYNRLVPGGTSTSTSTARGRRR